MLQESPQSPLELWKQKLLDYQRQEAITADPEQKFQIKRLIEECLQKIKFCQEANNFCPNESLDTLATSVGRIVFEDHQYDGQLVIIALTLYQEDLKIPKMIMSLTISFGECEEYFIEDEREGYIRLGIQHGKLHLKITNGTMPLNERKSIKVQEPLRNCQIAVTGINNKTGLKFKTNNQEVLYGKLEEEALGLIYLSTQSCLLDVEATFKRLFVKKK